MNQRSNPSRAHATPAPPANPDWRYSPPRCGRILRDPCDPSRGSVEVVEIDACAWAEMLALSNAGRAST